MELRTVELLVTLTGALATIAILSVVFKENALYRFFEHLFIGIAAGYGVVVTWNDALGPNWYQPLREGQWYWVFAPLLALLFYSVFFPKYAWLSRFLISVLFGLGAGQVFRGFSTQVFPQVTSSFVPLWPSAAVSWGQVFSNLVFVVTLVSVMAYFFFSFRHGHKAVAGTAQLGRWLLMIAFGAIFGSTVMGRFSLLIDRIQFLLDVPGLLFK
ncbi:MAG: hypothetical protein IT204_04285 [Fimbriimonadaceae bacterium]|nr:hypothetical protein [Fimbriimonadaceae bacterium]